MGIDWKRADTDGWDIEDVDKPRSVADTCPRCGQASRLLERERVKNLTVFGVSLVATERGGRVFECTLCRARFEAPEGVIDQLTGLHDQLDKVEEDIALWSGRVTIAARSRDAALAKEAQDMVERRSRAAASLRAEVDRLGRQLRRGSAADETAQAPVRRGLLLAAASAPTVGAGDEQAPAPAAVEAAGAKVDDELAALRQKVAAKVAAVSAPSPAPSKEDELTALKRRLGMIPKEGAGDAPAEPAEPAAPGDAVAVDDEVAALKRRLRGDAPPTANPVEAPTPSDDDELSDLKSRLRPKR
jgi:hypothetical protein